MIKEISITVGGAEGVPVDINASMAVRHGMIAGATGSGKTVTLQALAEGFSRLGTPVFLADVKGDLSGLAAEGKENRKIKERLPLMGLPGFKAGANPVVFWDLLGKQGHPVRTTVSEMGPMLLATALELNEAQTGVLYTIFRVADDNGFLLLDLKDLRAMMNFASENRTEITTEYGLVSTASLGAIGRRLLILEEQGGGEFFGEPAFDIEDFMRLDFSGAGVINILDAAKLINASPKLYAIFLLWFLSELFENLPEAGEVEVPKLVFFFDEAHLLFSQAPKTLLEKIEQVARLIRSKGVGVFFISQSPLDVPENILGQMGLKIQHALRAFTPKDRKTVKAVANSFPSNPDIDTEEAITGLAVGEALVSSLDGEGRPTPVRRIFIKPPESRLGPLTKAERGGMIARSPLKGKYDDPFDRESAYEALKKAAEKRAAEQVGPPPLPESSKRQSPRASGGRGRQGIGEAMMKSAARALGGRLGSSIGGRLGKSITRGLLGSIFKKGGYF